MTAADIGYQEPMLDAFAMARTLSVVPERPAFEAEAEAYARHIAGDEWRPDAPHRHFSKSIGNWARIEAQGKRKRAAKSGPVRCSPAEAFDASADLEDIFGRTPEPAGELA